MLVDTKGILDTELRRFFQRLDPFMDPETLNSAVAEASDYLSKAAAIAAASGFHDTRSVIYLAKHAYKAFTTSIVDEVNRVALAHFNEAMQEGAAKGMCPTYKGVPMAQWQFDALMEAEGFKLAPKAEGQAA